MIFLTSPRTHLQTHSGEISMGAASGNGAGKPPEILSLIHISEPTRP